MIEVANGEKSYILSETGTDWEYWLENEAGEGMSLSEKNLFDLLDKYFQEEF